MGGVDVVTPAEEFSSGAWLRAAAAWAAMVPLEVPIVIVGGTGLYFSALLRGLDRRWEKPPPEYPVIRIDRAVVRARIAARLDAMFMAGLEEEKRRLKGLYPVLDQEGMGADVVSPGEIYTALAGGFPAERLYFHGNNKTDEDIAYALESGVGCFIVDNHNELDRLDDLAGEFGVKQKVLLRVTPGIDPHTLQAINTGRIDCQFGVPIETGQAERFVMAALKKPNLEVMGFHSHIGSQIFEAEPFCDAVDILLDFAQKVREDTGFTLRVLNLGGGFGVRYKESDPTVDIAGNIQKLSEHLKNGCAGLNYPVPQVLLEPGRSIVADACVTLYRAGGVKTIDGYRSYVTVNGGMTDNPRYALYQSPYTVLPAGRMKEQADFVIALPHWGTEYRLRHDADQGSWAEWLAAEGVDAVVGAHPHVVQDTTHIRGVPVIYSLGNTVSNMSAPNTRIGLLATLRFVSDPVTGEKRLLEPRLRVLDATGIED